MFRLVAAALVVLAGCAHKREAPAPADDAAAGGVAAGAWLAELKAQRTSDPGDLGAAYLAAYVAGMAGKTAEALAILEGLAGGWPFPVQASDFPKLAGEPRFQAVLARTAGRGPAGAATTAFTLGPADLVPEGIACDAASGAVYVGSIVRRKIVRVDGTASRDLVTEGRDGLGGVLGMTVDASRRWLWAAHNPLGEAARAAGEERSGVAAFDLDTGATKVSATLEGNHLLNDVALAGADVYVSDSTRGAVWRLRGGQGELERVAADGTFVYPNGVAWVAEAARLLVADAGGLHVLDPASGQRRRVGRGPAPTLAGIDGLQRVGADLVAVQNGDRVVRWRLDPAALAVTAESVLLARHPSFATPTTGCALGERYLVIANSHVIELDDDGRPRDPGKLRPLEVLAVSLQ